MKLTYAVDRTIRYLLLGMAGASVVIVLLIAVFTFMEALPAFREIGLIGFIFNPVWHPLPDDPANSEYGIGGMIYASVIVTLGAIGLGAPLGVGCAVFLAEIAPEKVIAMYRVAGAQ